MKKQEWSTEGILNKGFQGHIVYSVLLPKKAKGVRITFEFNKRKAESDFEEWNHQCLMALKKNIPEEDKDLAQKYIDAEFYKKLKSELNITIYHNGVCLGSAHKDKTYRVIEISEKKASEGFEPHSFEGGILEISMHVWDVLNNNTSYRLHVVYDAE